MDNILRERRLRWLGYVFRMDHQRIPQQALYWQVPGYKGGPGRPRANWRGVVSKDLRKMGVHLGGSRGGSSWQTRMASECGPLCPVGYGLNQGQGQGHHAGNPKLVPKNVTNVWARGLTVLPLFGIWKNSSSTRVQKIKFELYWARVGSSYSSNSTRNSPINQAQCTYLSIAKYDDKQAGISTNPPMKLLTYMLPASCPALSDRPK